jgi:hypothetical protein
VPLKGSNGREWKTLLDPDMVNESTMARAEATNPTGGGSSAGVGGDSSDAGDDRRGGAVRDLRRDMAAHLWQNAPIQSNLLLTDSSLSM